MIVKASRVPLATFEIEFIDDGKKVELVAEREKDQDQDLLLKATSMNRGNLEVGREEVPFHGGTRRKLAALQQTRPTTAVKGLN
jgi:hypothetical protein